MTMRDRQFPVLPFQPYLYVTTRRLVGQRRVWAGLPYVVMSGWSARSDPRTAHSGTLNRATGETATIKKIQLSNMIPKGELGQIVARASVSYAWASIPDHLSAV